MSRNYADTAPFNWLRKKLNLNKPRALGWGQWDKWEKELKEKHPIGFFLTETLPDLLELPAEYLIDPYNDFRYYCRLRFKYKSHYLKTGLTPGQWYDYDTRILHGLFNELVDFVEVEKANNQFMWGNKDRHAKYNVPFWRKYYIFHWGMWRCPEAGLDHLRWEANLDDPALDVHEKSEPQAIQAREIIILYTWWKTVRLPRDEDSASTITGYTAFHDMLGEKYGEDWFLNNTRNQNPAERAESHRLMLATHDLEEQWHKEDEEMMIRLIKIRRGLWT